MFKAQTLRRSFSLFRSIPTSQVVKSATRDGHETIQIQRVRFKRRFFSRSRIIGIGISTAAAYQFIKWIEEDDDDEEEESQQAVIPRRRPLSGEGTESEGNEVDQGDDEEEEEAEALLFFPTGASRPKPRRYYKGSDPEWQEFIRMAQDKDRLLRIRGELIDLVRTLAAKQLNARIGKIDTSKGSAWIECKWPDGPPLEYERPGIELTEDLELRRTTRDVEMINHHRLNHILMPTAVANSLYADWKRRFVATWKEMMGTQSKPSPFPFPLQQPPSALSGPPSTFPTAPPPPGALPTAPPTTTSSSTPSPSSSPSPASPPSPTDPSPLSNPLLSHFTLLPKPDNLLLDMTVFRHAFALEMRKKVKDITVEPPKGAFILTGLVEVIGDKAKLTLDVVAAYDPKTAKFVRVGAKVRTMTEMRQRPKGGP